MVKAEVCKTSIRRFESARRLQFDRPMSRPTANDSSLALATQTQLMRMYTARRTDKRGRGAFHFNPVPRWRNGRRGGLKIRYLLEVCGFDPLPRHQFLNKGRSQTQVVAVAGNHSHLQFPAGLGTDVGRRPGPRRRPFRSVDEPGMASQFQPGNVIYSRVRQCPAGR